MKLAGHTPATSLGDIVRHTENVTLVECFHPPTNTCPIHRGCQLKPILHQAQRAFFDVLDAHTVDDLAKRPAGFLPEAALAPRRKRT